MPGDTHIFRALKTTQTAYRFKRTVEIYQKALQIYNKVENGLQSIVDFIDLLSFDPSDIKKIVDELSAVGISKGMNALPAGIVDRKIKLPRALFNKLEKVSKRLYNVGLFHAKVQEIMGEAGTAM